MSLDSVKKIMSKACQRKQVTCQNVKTSANKGKRTKTQVTQHGFDTDVASTSGLMYVLPPLNRFREGAIIQTEVQNRLRHLADYAKPGTEKIKSQRGKGGL